LDGLEPSMALLAHGVRTTAVEIPHVLHDDDMQYRNSSCRPSTTLSLRPTRAARAFANDANDADEPEKTALALLSSLKFGCEPPTLGAWRTLLADRMEVRCFRLDLLEAAPLDHHSPHATATSAPVNTSINVSITKICTL